MKPLLFFLFCEPRWTTHCYMRAHGGCSAHIGECNVSSTTRLQAEACTSYKQHRKAL